VARKPAALAKELGVSGSTLGLWLNFGVNAPSYAGKHLQERRMQIDIKLRELIGVGFDEVFPVELRTEAFKAKQKKMDQVYDLPIEQLVFAGAMPALPPSPLDLAESQQRREICSEVLDTLRPREAMVIRMRFGLDGEGEATLRDVSDRFGWKSTERARQVEARALRKLREPQRARVLKGFVSV
jgi:RNA polymerase sigma factor (sigma-70 family)